MKKYFGIFLLLICGASIAGVAQVPNIQWQKTLGGTDEDKANSVCVLQDGSIVIAGSALSNNGDVSGNHMAWGGSEDFWIVKLDSNGYLQWQKCYGGNSIDVAYSIKQTLDGGFIIAGAASSNDGDVTGLHNTGLYPFDYWVIKIEGNGNLQWQKCYGGTADDKAYDIELTNDSGYVLVGVAQSWDGDVTYNHFPGYGDAWVVKINSIGTLQWQKSLGGTNWDDGYSIKQTYDGGYAVGVLTASNDGDVTCTHGISDYWLVKLDNNGNIQWSQCYGGSGSDALFSLDVTKDHGFILAGYVDSNDGDVIGLNGLTDIWIVKTDSNGTLQWAKCYGGSDYEEGWAVRTTSDSGAIITGSSYSGDSSAFCNHGFYSDLWALKVDKLGNLDWSKCMGGGMEDAGRDIVEINNGGYVVVGYSKSNDGDVSGNHGGTCVSDSCPDYWVVKLSPLGTEIRPETLLNDLSTFIDNKLHVSFNSTSFSHGYLKLIDILGQTILELPIEIKSGFNKNEMLIPELSTGVYMVSLTTNAGLVVGKCIRY